MTAARALRTPTFAALLEQQNGVLSRQQWLALGETARSWNWERGRGHWQTVIPGVALLHSGEPTRRQLSWAAVLHAGHDALLHGDAALVEHGFARLDVATLDVTVAHPRRVVGGRLLGGARMVTHSLPQQDESAVRAGAPPIATPAAAVLRAAAWAPSDRAASWRIAAAVQQQLTSPAHVRTVMSSMADLPRADLVLRVLDDVELGAHSGTELEFLSFVRRNNIPEPDRLQILVRTATGKRYLDGRYDKQKVTVEVDGAHHMDVEQWDADSMRSLELAVHRRGSGETLIRLTMGNLRHTEARTAALLRDLLV